MTRFATSSLLAVAVAATLIATAQTADAGGCGKHRGYYHPPVRVYHRPVHVVRPVVVAPAPIVTPAAVLAPAPAPAPGPRLTSVPVGSTITLPGNFLGDQPGQAFLVMGQGQVKLPLQIRNWTPGAVTLSLPPMGLVKETPAQIAILLPNGQIGNQVDVLLVAPANVIVHPNGPAPTAAIGPAPAPAAIPGPIRIEGQQTAMAGLPFGS